MNEAVVTALGQLDDDDSGAAWETIYEAVEYPSSITADDLGPALDVLARSGAEMMGDEWSSELGPAAGDPGNTDALGAAGSFLIEQGFAGLAATVLGLAFERAPLDPHLLAELITAHEQITDHSGAVRILSAIEPSLGEGFLPRYLLAFNAVMSFDVETARSVRTALLESASNDAEVFMASRIDGILARFDAICAAAGTTPEKADLQAWHLIRTGGLLLDTAGPMSAYGDYRSANREDTAESCREGIARVSALLDALGVGVSAVLALSDESSQILAAATAQVIGTDVSEWPSRSDAPGLVVVYDLESCPPSEAEALSIHEPDQILWAHTVRWTNDRSVTPDIATHLHQRTKAPWTTDNDGTDEAVARETWTRSIVEANPEPADHTSSDARLRDLADATRDLGDHAAGVFRSSGRREKQFAVPLVIEAF